MRFCEERDKEHLEESLKSLAPYIQSEVLSFEKLKKEVSVSGNITHVTSIVNRKNGISPLLFWTQIAVGKKEDFKYYFSGESTTSFNITEPNGLNRSLDDGPVTLRCFDVLLLFSRHAAKRLCGHLVREGDEIKPLIDEKTGLVFEEVLKEEMRKSLYVPAFLSACKVFGIKDGVDYYKNCANGEVNYARNAGLWYLLAPYLHVCLQKNARELNGSGDVYRESLLYISISAHTRMDPSAGWRFRDFRRDPDGQIYLSDAVPVADDIGAIVITISRARNYGDETYLMIRFPGRELMG
ncbi:MAG: hypothetical protein GYA55_09745 [SAR324 cluster bacterium]|uniref:Uncharacterized protein n=1 Tax=SAR324 cluster bacterium TaxID=2024889 RepID=A0A7X9IKS8_9DELT|nr:hypothetical protein [SAR324 cluster bacterium]